MRFVIVMRDFKGMSGGALWQDLKVGKQEVPQGVLALDEMPTGTTRDEHQPVVVSSSEDVNTSRHRRTSRSYIDRSPSARSLV